jgi:hypothetical protein
MLAPMCIRVVALLAAFQGTGAGSGGGGRGGGRGGGGRGDGAGHAQGSSDAYSSGWRSWNNGPWSSGSTGAGSHGGWSWGGGNQGDWSWSDGRWSNDDAASATSSQWSWIPDPSAVPVLNRNTGKGQDAGKGQGTGKGSDTGKGQDAGKGSDAGKGQGAGRGSASSSVGAGHLPMATDDDTSSSVGAGSLPTATGEEGANKGLFCRRCKEGGRCTTLIYEHDWQGTLWCVCFQCWRLEQDTDQDDDAAASSFERLRKASWRQRIGTAKAVQRGLCIAKMVQDVVREPNESKRNCKRRIITCAVSMVKAFVQDMLRLNDEDLGDVDRAFTLWDQEASKIQADPEHISTLGCVENLLPEEVMQFASEISEHVSEYFLCRNGIDGSGGVCGYFGPGTAWAATDLSAINTGGHWRCPL